MQIITKNKGRLARSTKNVHNNVAKDTMKKWKTHKNSQITKLQGMVQILKNQNEIKLKRVFNKLVILYLILNFNTFFKKKTFLAIQ